MLNTVKDVGRFLYIHLNTYMKKGKVYQIVDSFNKKHNKPSRTGVIFKVIL